MPKRSTETLSEYDLKALAVLMAKDPELVKTLVDALSETLDEKFGHRQGDVFFELDDLKGQFKALDQKFDHMQEGIDTLTHNLQVFAERQETVARDSEKRLLRAIDYRLGSTASNLSRNR